MFLHSSQTTVAIRDVFCVSEVNFHFLIHDHSILQDLAMI